MPPSVPTQAQSLDGVALRQAVVAATRLLERYRELINALNVFPVPDGDTGTNMHLTMRSVVDALEQSQASSVGDVAAVIARGALLGARGNSGVILSQYLEGLSQGLRGREAVDGAALALALAHAGAAAYHAVSKPVEGTMLTVAREAGLTAEKCVQGRAPAPLAVLQAALSGARDALKRTPELLPVLRDAGVVDAGGQGLVVLLEGLVGALQGQDVDTLQVELAGPSVPGGVPQVSEAYLRQVEGETFGYCVQFMLRGADMDVAAMRQHLGAMADSTVVVGDSTLVKVHVHAADPGPVISYAVARGTISDVRMENIDAMHEEFAALHRSGTSLGGQTAVAVVAVAWGDGFGRVFANIGAAPVASGRTMNPSTQELLQAVEQSGGQDVVLLPNNPNVVAAARQAASVATARRVHVVPTVTLPRGVAAALAYNPDLGLEANLEAMARAAQSVTTVEVVRAARDAVVDGRQVREGVVMGIVEGRLAETADTPTEALVGALRRVAPRAGSLVTIYWGADGALAQRAAAAVRAAFPEVDVEVVYGGQPHYDFIVSVE